MPPPKTVSFRGGDLDPCPIPLAECFLHTHTFPTEPPASTAKCIQLLSHTHHPAAHCVSMATGRPGPWMLETSARGRREKVGEENGKRNVRGKEKVLKDGLVGRPLA